MRVLVIWPLFFFYLCSFFFKKFSCFLTEFVIIFPNQEKYKIINCACLCYTDTIDLVSYRFGIIIFCKQHKRSHTCTRERLLLLCHASYCFILFHILTIEKEKIIIFAVCCCLLLSFRFLFTTDNNIKSRIGS